MAVSVLPPMPKLCIGYENTNCLANKGDSAMRRIAVLLLIACFMPMFMASAQAERRIALVIGNGVYKEGPLKNPVNDARDMAITLKSLGFEVILRENAALRQMEDALDEYWKELQKGGVGLFYFAGHGMQVNGVNYLIPVDARIVVEQDVKSMGFDVNRLLGRLDNANNGLNIVLFDACRNNPFARSWRSIEAGLAKMDAPAGTLIGYATAPDSVAADGLGRNGTYTKHLLREMKVSGKTIEAVLKQVRIGVLKDTERKQVPWESSSLTGDFYFAPIITPASVNNRHENDIKQKNTSSDDEISHNFNEDKSNSALSDGDIHEFGSLDDWFRLGKAAYDKYNNDDALKWFKKAASGGHSEAQVYLGLWYASGLDPDHGKDEAVELFTNAYKSGSLVAAYNLGLMYCQGAGVQKDIAKGFELIRGASDGGYAKAKFALYRILKGDKYNSSKREMSQLLVSAADQGYPIAQYELGLLYANGDQFKRDYSKASYWFEKASRLGVVDASIDLALLKCNINNNPSKAEQRSAFQIMQSIALKGSSRATFLLGQFYAQGIGVSQNLSEATKLWRDAATLGNAYAAFMLGRSYMFGEGVPTDRDEGLRLLLLAADAGLPEAYFSLGLLSNKDFKYTSSELAWFMLAAEQGDAKAEGIRDNIIKRMSQSEIQEARNFADQRRARSTSANLVLAYP